MRLRFALAMVLAGCGADPQTPPNVARTTLRDAGSDARPDAALDAGDPLATDPLKLAPGMREVVRSEIAITANATVAIPANADADVCVRVAVRPITVRAKLVAKSGTLGEGATIGDKGPVCARKGDALTVELSADQPTRARIVVWSSP
jgi:hypothetical protein